MKAIIVFIWACVVGISACGQNQTSNNYLHQTYTLDRISTNSMGSQSSSIPLSAGPPPGVKGDVYLNKTFNRIVFQLYEEDKIVDGYTGKLDLRLNEFDVLTRQGIRVIKGNLVRSFIFVDSLSGIQTDYINLREWTTPDKVKLDGFGQVIVDGNLMLVRTTELIVRKPDFNPALNVGSKDYRFLKKDHFHYVKAGVLTEVPGKKNFPKIFGDKEKIMSEYITKNNLSISNEKELARIFDYYNRLQ
ncbi:MAG: hypothetical protein J0L66_14505 [Cytophagales bacterium]|nr:hypothetical protein [Cytophagales bacterium]